MGNRYYSKRLRDITKRKDADRRNTSRPKSFKTEEAANKWADVNKIKDYTLRNLKSTANKLKKLIIVKK